MIRLSEWNIVIVYSFTPDAKSPAAKVYEERVRIAVNAIGRSQTGRTLLKSMSKDPDTPLWIMPYNGPAGQCQSKTGAFYGDRVGPANPKAPKQSYEGERIQFSPERFETDSCGWYPGLRPEETLFHEMVHASREMTNGTYDNTPMDLMGDLEEFLAVLITNIYRSELHARKFHRDYVLKLLVEQKEAELYLSSKRIYIDGLQFALDDTLVKAMVNMKTAYNPFRDFKRLEADHSDIREMLNDLNPFVRLNEQERIRKIGEKLTEQREMSMESSAKAIHHK